MSGVLLLPFAISKSVATVSTGIYLKKTCRYNDCIRVGFILLVLGMGLFYDLPNGKIWSNIIIYQLISGFGVGLIFQPPLIALQSHVPAQYNAAATASFGLVCNVASAIGVVIGSVVFSNRMNAQQDPLRALLGPTTADLFSGSNAQANVPLIENLNDNQKDAVRRAFWVSLRDIWVVGVAFAAAGLVVCFFIGDKKLDKTHVEVKVGLEGEEKRRKITDQQRKRAAEGNYA
ncbi:uncharacterized protein ASPGLDRAFT_31521 [Aspergillus glaucus CBS 516.65]|uniref:Major facilitator superfamily (MFS) profile domain-containing protein n=1 Tax=Aspergillus glaucus CBS 516.65 TaxID=1160497 RepID=A0A1L9VWV1_ASPGL|nr:hypothetical protein ASPGLDRAFT_31521 [Aspergillus glaucus CBS 516.65]OJJ88367.1 hypothetical protein ASPGLDRAFT_31521 [Aspergillus glaucus CBS 516.65]